MSRALFILRQAIEEAIGVVRDDKRKREAEKFTVLFRKRNGKTYFYKRCGYGADRAELPIDEKEADELIHESIKRMQHSSDKAVMDEVLIKQFGKLLKEINKRLDYEQRYICGKYRAVPRESQMGAYEDGLQHVTARGEYVRSKSEVIIANALHANKIDYFYEKPIHQFYPDFTIPISVQGRPIYWEHCGIMNDERYAERWYYKKKELEKLGIKENDNLIVTFDGPNGIIDSKVINRIINKWFSV